MESQSRSGWCPQLLQEEEKRILVDGVFHRVDRVIFGFIDRFNALLDGLAGLSDRGIIILRHQFATLVCALEGQSDATG